MIVGNSNGNLIVDYFIHIWNYLQKQSRKTSSSSSDYAFPELVEALGSFHPKFQCDCAAKGVWRILANPISSSSRAGFSPQFCKPHNMFAITGAYFLVANSIKRELFSSSPSQLLNNILYLKHPESPWYVWHFSHLQKASADFGFFLR